MVILVETRGMIMFGEFITKDNLKFENYKLDGRDFYKGSIVFCGHTLSALYEITPEGLENPSLFQNAEKKITLQLDLMLDHEIRKKLEVFDGNRD